MEEDRKEGENRTYIEWWIRSTSWWKNRKQWTAIVGEDVNDVPGNTSTLDVEHR